MQKPDNVMPIQDKMLLWARKNDQLTDDPDQVAASTDNTKRDQDRDQDDDIPWGNEVGDDDGLLQNFPEINEYRQTLLGSAAYSWLLKSVISEVELEIPAGADNSRSKIRKNILGFIHEPSKISQRSAPPAQRIAFRLPWIRNYLVSQEYDIPIQEALPHAMVIVGVDNQTFVTSCGEYLETLWPDIGPQILGLCISLLSSLHGGIATCEYSSLPMNLS